MQSVDFYVIDPQSQRPWQWWACRLVATAYGRGHRIFVRAENWAQAQELDEQLWVFAASSFLPHELAGDADAARAPIQIGTDPGDAADCDVLVNVAASAPPASEAFARVAELVGAEPEARRAGRQRYRAYRDRGVEPGSHTLGGAAAE